LKPTDPDQDIGAIEVADSGHHDRTPLKPVLELAGRVVIGRLIPVTTTGPH